VTVIVDVEDLGHGSLDEVDDEEAATQNLRERETKLIWPI